MPTEKQTQHAILAAIGSRPDVRLWRANCGVAVPASSAVLAALDRQRVRYSVVRFGLTGQADLTGIREGGQRVEIEVKAPKGRSSEEQNRYGEMIRRHGGVYIVAKSVEDVLTPLFG